jgi:hypothetical protein
MPAMQGRAALGLIDPPGEKDHQQRQYRNDPFFSSEPITAPDVRQWRKTCFMTLSLIFRVAELICPIPDRLFSLSASQHSHRLRQIKPGRSFMFGEKSLPLRSTFGRVFLNTV